MPGKVGYPMAMATSEILGLRDELLEKVGALCYSVPTHGRERVDRPARWWYELCTRKESIWQLGFQKSEHALDCSNPTEPTEPNRHFNLPY